MLRVLRVLRGWLKFLPDHPELKFFIFIQPVKSQIERAAAPSYKVPGKSLVCDLNHRDFASS
jgi:hypothetical protein